MNQEIAVLGMILVFIGIALLAFSTAGEKGKVHIGVGGFIGPIPFGFATEKNMLYLTLIITIIMAALMWWGKF